MERSPKFLARYAPWFLHQLAPATALPEEEADQAIRKVRVTSAIMPDLKRLFMDSREQLNRDARDLMKKAAPRREIQEIKSKLRTIQTEARLGDKANYRLAKAVDVTSGRDLVEAVSEKIANPSGFYAMRTWRPSILVVMSDYHLAAENLVAAAFVGIRHKKELADQALHLLARLTFY